MLSDSSMKSTSAKEALKNACETAGGVSALSAKIGITSQAISQWERVPASRVLDVERETGVSRYLLRPDVFGASTSQPTQEATQ